jgi:hypothetical protein
MGGTSYPHSSCCCNLITMLGSATTGCHGRVESRRYRSDHGKGYRLEHGQVPALTSVMVFGLDGGFTAFPTCDGQWSDRPGSVAA